MIDERGFRETFQPMMREELMRAWREGMRDGLNMAHKMAGAVRDEVYKRRCYEDCPEEQREALDAQIVVLSGLMAGILNAAEEAGASEEAL